MIVANGRYRELGSGFSDVMPADADAEAIRRYVSTTLGVSEDNVIFLRDAKRADLVTVFGGETDHRGQLFDWVEPGPLQGVRLLYRTRRTRRGNR